MDNIKEFEEERREAFMKGVLVGNFIGIMTVIILALVYGK